MLHDIHEHHKHESRHNSTCQNKHLLSTNKKSCCVAKINKLHKHYHSFKLLCQNWNTISYFCLPSEHRTSTKRLWLEIQALWRNKFMLSSITLTLVVRLWKRPGRNFGVSSELPFSPLEEQIIYIKSNI